MSNSDGTSNSDEKLDALYKMTQQHLDSRLSTDDVSPPDIDASLLAAAREATAGGAADIDAPASSGLTWQQRYGWATAATLLLTSVLFVSVTDSDPQMDAFSNDSEAVSLEAPATNQSELRSNAKSAPVSDTLRQSAPASAPATVPTPETADTQADFLARSKHSRTLQSMRTKPTEAIEEIVVPASPVAQKQLLDSTQESLKKSPLGITGLTSDCSDYPGILIDLVCTRNSKATTRVVLRANKQSSCAGQTLYLSDWKEPPIAHSSSTFSRFVMQNSDATTQPAEEIICQSGKLVRQSLARGR